MTFSMRAAGRTASAFLFAAGALFAQPAFAAAADGAPAIAVSTEAAAVPGIDSLEEAIGRAVELPAPVLEEPRSLEQLVAQYADGEARDEQADCLAAAVYFESNGEPFAGQLAVAEVIINRARSGRFAETLCGVITQRSQFSFVRGGRIPSPPRTSAAWRNAVAIAHIALDDRADSPVSDALFFHARYVNPRWRLQRLAAVGNHIFYR
jgi:N-acetylmuramoyl-L-alanine amidase